MPIKIVQKLWGTEFWEVNTDLYCLKIMAVAPGKRCSLHRHLIKDETFLCRFGRILIETVDPESRIGDMLVLRKGETIRISPGTWHRFSNFGNDAALLEEVSTHHEDSDVERWEESGNIPDDVVKRAHALAFAIAVDSGNPGDSIQIDRVLDLQSPARQPH